MTAQNENSRVALFGGLTLAGVGLAHFVQPRLFDRIVVVAFPRDTRKHVYANGVIETAIGLGFAVPTTRKLATIGLLAYGTYVAAHVAPMSPAARLRARSHRSPGA